MPRILANRLLHPLRYPEWAEILFGFIGLLQTILSVWMFDELQLRAALYLVIALTAKAWCASGAILFLMHIIPLRFGHKAWSYRWRVYAAGCSLAFWVHFIGSVILAAVLSGTDLPITILPALAAPMFAGGVFYRLYRHY